MRAQTIHHIGHAVDDLDAAIADYQQLLGGVLEHRETVPDQGVEAATMLLGRRASCRGRWLPIRRSVASSIGGVPACTTSRWKDDLERALRTPPRPARSRSTPGRDRAVRAAGCVHSSPERGRRAGRAGATTETERTWLSRGSRSVPFILIISAKVPYEEWSKLEAALAAGSGIVEFAAEGTSHHGRLEGLLRPPRDARGKVGF